ncbi:ATP-binding cassette domain-containing protein [Allokutzneria sp. A3M-2-11 16]|uniref:ATP-binding cassette domain-containing protein n=1 Tax=Allokutzneria sp. A3M-2-11 16 TaxID=2962043 RepID=UPI0020B8A463|nr:ATP-binding cassette domain-containing protein [Allokutzneria sp. A3M-2-11 16]MCP3803020.1 ATP-binding cassette domain-containing protein [Allokutzneria sp. A3M-2-11 16]
MIHARKLAKRFKVRRGGVVEAVRGIDLDVERGQLVAVLGPNGAGKSTTLRMLTTLLPPTSGTATVAGRDIATDPAGVRDRIGYVGQLSSAGENYRVRDEIVTQGLAYGLSRSAARRRADEMLDLLDLRPMALRHPGSLSGGQRRRLDIAIGLVHRPELLFLDEPSTGLDPHNRANVWEHVLRLREQYGTTIVLTTHYLEEADTMAERVVIIDNGRIIADGTAGGLKSELAGDSLEVTTATEADALRAADVGVFFGDVTRESTTVRVRVTRADTALPEFLRVLGEKDVRAVTATSARPTLDDVFLALTGRSLREDEVAA